jgi:hypothetical protein
MDYYLASEEQINLFLFLANSKKEWNGRISSSFKIWRPYFLSYR